MCGIVGYIGNKDGAPVVLSGLQALEYRGYDSAGLVTLEKNKSRLVKQVGRVEGLVKKTSEAGAAGNLAIGHTRWATHGSPTMLNAHPHVN